MRSFGLGAAVGLGVGSLGTYILVSQTQREKVSESGASHRTEHPAVKYGQPVGNRMKYFTGYVAALDSSRGNPAWVLEHVTKDSSRGPGDRAKSDFYEEKSVEQRFRSSLSAYKGSGYDRGHMAPAQNHKGSQQAMNDTHSLMNICPQVGKGFNRDYWARLEMFVKQLALKKGNEVYVVTGPLYVPKRTENGKGWVMQHPMIGRAPRMTAVPTHFYKIVLVEETAKKGTTEGSGNISCGAFVMPNEPIDPATPLTDYLVPMQMLESVSGYRFFPRLIDDKDRARLDDSAAKLSTLGLSSSSKAKPFMIEAGSLEDDKPAALSRSNSSHIAPQGSDKSNNEGADSAAVTVASPGDRRLNKAAAASNGVPNGNKHLSHLCNSFTCKLPAEDFWMSANKTL